MSIELDLHGSTVSDAIHTIQRTIVENPLCDLIIAIHGFNNGNALKTTLSNKYNIHNKRVISTSPYPYNEGRTIIYLKAVKFIGR